jgi:xylitol oxidase
MAPAAAGGRGKVEAESGCGMTARETNWAGNIVYRAARVARPRSVSEAQELVAAGGQVRAVGTGHSFNRIADTRGVLISLADLPPVVDIEPGGAAVTVAGGIRYGELTERLNAAGHALPSLASLPHLSVAGAVATATHGSGDAHGNLATTVSGLDLIAADGSVRTLRRDTGGEEFRGSVVGLGSLGLVTALTLDLVPAFSVRQYVYEGLPAAILQSHFDEIFGSAYSVSVFTNWRGDRHSQLWLKVRDGEADGWQPAPRWMDATLADRQVHPIPGGDPAHATQQLGVPGPWHERLPHFRAEFTPSSGQELQSEYLLSRQVAAGAFDAMASLGSLMAPVLQIAEIRTVAPDDLWLSPSFQRDTVALHFTWVKDTAAVTPVIAAMEQLLTPLGARPHWAKVFGMPPHLVRALYPRSADFQDLLCRYDPDGKFRNGFIDKYLPVRR